MFPSQFIKADAVELAPRAAKHCPGPERPVHIEKVEMGRGR
jgi:hypothetical protein